MMEDTNRTCPKTGRPIPSPSPRTRELRPLTILGFVSLAWFLIRVVPKPTRATYPCQRAAAPLAAGFLAWLAGLAAPAVLFRKARALSVASRSGSAWLLAAAAAVAGGAWSLQSFPALLRAHPATEQPYVLFDGPLAPVGIGRGIVPGRVVWVHDPKAVRWELTGSWWEDAYNDQAAINGMLSHSLQWLTNQTTDAKA